MKFLNQRMNRASYWLCIKIMVIGSAFIVAVLKDKPRVSEGLLHFLFIPRLHDLGRSGWWSLLPIVIEIGLIAGFFAIGQPVLGAGLATLAMALCIMVLGVLPGQRTPN